MIAAQLCTYILHTILESFMSNDRDTTTIDDRLPSGGALLCATFAATGKSDSEKFSFRSADGSRFVARVGATSNAADAASYCKEMVERSCASTFSGRR